MHGRCGFRFFPWGFGGVFLTKRQGMFVSHQWACNRHADPGGRQFRVLQGKTFFSWVPNKLGALPLAEVTPVHSSDLWFSSHNHGNENRCISKISFLYGGNFPLPWLWEEGYPMFFFQDWQFPQFEGMIPDVLLQDLSWPFSAKTPQTSKHGHTEGPKKKLPTRIMYPNKNTLTTNSWFMEICWLISFFFRLWATKFDSEWWGEGFLCFCVRRSFESSQWSGKGFAWCEYWDALWSSTRIF